MKFEEMDNAGPMDDLLREYLLEQNPEGLHGESLMEQAALGEMGRGPSLTPSTGGREAEMIAKLKAHAEARAAAAQSGRWLRRLALWSLPAAATLTLALWFALGDSAANKRTLALQNEPLVVKSHSSAPPEDASPELNRSATEPSLRTLFTPTPVKNQLQPREVQTPSHQLLPLFTQTFGEPVPGPSAPAYLVSNPEISTQFYQNLSPASQWQSVDNQNGIQLSTASGTTLIIPADCFVTRDGQVARGAVQVKVTESLGSIDLLRSGLSFYASGQYFTSKGAILVEALQFGQPLEVGPGKEMYAELPASFYDQGGDLFTAKPDAEGRDWQRLTTQDRSLVPLNPDDLYFHQFWCMDHRDVQWNDYLVAFTGEEFSNSFIPTLQFRERLKAAWQLGHHGEILRIYRNNLHLYLWQADELVVEYLKRNPLPENFELPFDPVKKFQQFSMQGYTRATPYLNHGLDPAQPAQREELHKKLSAAQYDELMRLHYLRTRQAAQLEESLFAKASHGSRNKKLMPVEESGAVAVKRGIRLNHTGWVTIGRALPAEQVGEIAVTLEGQPSLELIDVYFVGEAGKTLAAADLIFSDHTALPAPAAAKGGWVVAIGYDHGNPWLGMTQVNASAQEARVEMQALSFDQMRTRLSEIEE